MEKTSYRSLRWQRAWADTKQFVLARAIWGVGIAAATGLLAAPVSYLLGEPINMDTVYVAALIASAAIVVMGLSTLFYYWSVTPSHIHEEDQKKIAELEKVQEQCIEGLRTDFAQDFHDYADARGDLWSILDFASARQRETEVDPGSVRECMKRAEFPEDILGIGQNEQLYDYAKNAVEGWGDGRREFLDFCLSLYRQDGSSPLNRYERTSLDVYRRDLSKFWEEWGRRCSRQNISIGNIAPPDIVQNQTPDVVMLTYLEIARGLHWKENSRGKQGLFKVAQEFREFSNL